MFELILLSLATASVSFTVTEAHIFHRLREWVIKRNQFLGKLINCGYCLGHWIAAVLVITYQFRILNKYLILDYIVTILIVAWLSSLQWVIMDWLISRKESIHLNYKVEKWRDEL